MRNPLDEKYLHRVFEISLIIKATVAFLEIIGGVVVFFVSQQFVLNLVVAVTQDERAEDPRDFIANYLLHSAQNFSLSAQHFAALFLLSHGVIKMFLIVGLLREKLLYYPSAIVVFGFFIFYQLYRFTYTHSFWLLLVTILDIGVIWLTWHEYDYLRAHRTARSSA